MFFSIHISLFISVNHTQFLLYVKFGSSRTDIAALSSGRKLFVSLAVCFVHNTPYKGNIGHQVWVPEHGQDIFPEDGPLPGLTNG